MRWFRIEQQRIENHGFDCFSLGINAEFCSYPDPDYGQWL